MKLLLILSFQLLTVSSYSQEKIIKFQKTAGTKVFQFIGEKVLSESTIHYLILKDKNNKIDTVWSSKPGLDVNSYLQVIDVYLNENLNTCSFLLSKLREEKLITCLFQSDTHWMKTNEIRVNITANPEMAEALSKISLIGEKVIRLTFNKSTFSPKIIFVDDNNVEYYSNPIGYNDNNRSLQKKKNKSTEENDSKIRRFKSKNH